MVGGGTLGNLVGMFDGRFRAPVERAVKPVGDGLRRTGLTPDHLTLIGVLLSRGGRRRRSAAAACAAASLLVILAALPDLLDGALAKASGNASQRGAFFDSDGRPLHRHRASRRRRLVPGVVGRRPLGPAALRHRRLRLAHLLPAGQGRVARARRQGRADGAGRAGHPAVHRPAVRLAADPDPVDHAGADGVHRGPALRQGVAQAAVAPARRPASSAPGRAGAAAVSPGRTARRAPARRRRSTPAPVDRTAAVADPPTGVGRLTGCASASPLAAWPCPGRVGRRLAAPSASAPASGMRGTAGDGRAPPAAGRPGRCGPSRSRRAVQQAFDSYARYYVESFRLPALPPPSRRPPGFALEGYEHIADGLDAGQRRDPRPAPPRRLGVGRALAGRPRARASRSSSSRSSRRSCSSGSPTCASRSA